MGEEDRLSSLQLSAEELTGHQTCSVAGLPAWGSAEGAGSHQPPPQTPAAVGGLRAHRSHFVFHLKLYVHGGRGVLIWWFRIWLTFFFFLILKIEKLIFED